MSEPPISDAAAAAAAGADVGRRAKRAVVLVTGRGFLLRLVGLLSTVVLTRFLTPRDFGVLAIGLTAVGFSNLLNDGGVGAALLRRPTRPTHAELRGLVSIQFGLTSMIWSVSLVVALATGSTVAVVTAIMLLALPLASLKAPGGVLLEREMIYGPLVKVDIAETFVYYTLAIASVAWGAGVWGIAVAGVVKLAPGIGILWSTVPGAIALPGRGIAMVRPMLRFGIQFQAVAVISVLRDEGLNVLVAGLGGLNALGLWSIAERVLLVVQVVLESLWRVSFPAMARMLETRSDPSRAIGRTVATVAFGLGFVLVTVVTFGPDGVRLVFGPAWSDAAAVLPAACLGYALAGPVSTACAGYLYARGDARTILVAVVIHTLVLLGTTALLLPAAGLAAIGYGIVASGLVDLALLGRAARRTIDAPLLVPTVALVVTASLASIVGLAAGAAVGPTALGVASGILVGLIAYAAIAGLVNRWFLPVGVRLDLRALGNQLVPRARRWRVPHAGAHDEPSS